VLGSELKIMWLLRIRQTIDTKINVSNAVKREINIMFSCLGSMTNKYPDILFVDFIGKLDLTTVESALISIDNLLSDECRSLSLGIDGLIDIDSEMIGCLYVVSAASTGLKKAMTIRCVNPKVLRLLEFTCHKNLLDVCEVASYERRFYVYL